MEFMITDRYHLSLVGHLRSADYHRADHIVNLLVDVYPDMISMDSSQGMMEFQWTQYKESLIATLKPQREDIEGKLVLSTLQDGAVFTNGELKWTIGTFLDWASKLLPGELTDVFSSVGGDLFTDKATQSYIDYISNDKCEYVYMEFNQDGQPLGQITLELFKDLCPKTVQNFVSLCTGEAGSVEVGGAPISLSYKDSLIHRIVPNGWIQGGDICGGNGDSGYSIYGQYFTDECFAIAHDVKGILGMVNHGRNTNSSQFYITLGPAEWMDKRYVAFGHVIEGTSVLDKLGDIKTFNERPQTHCTITDCGRLTVKEEESEENNE